MTTTTTVKKRSLLDIQNDYTEYFDLLARVDLDEITDEEREQLEAFEANLAVERDTKLDNIGAFLKDLKAQAEARKKIADEMRALYQADANKVERLKGTLLRFFQSQGIDKAIDTLRCKIWKQRNGQAAFKWVDEGIYSDEDRIRAEVPERFQRQILTVDTAAIKAELEMLAPEIEELGNLQAELAVCEGSDPGALERAEEALKARIAEIEDKLAGTAYDLARLEYGEHIRIK